MSRAYRVQTLDRRLFGVFNGLVEDNDDPEHEGRVRVRLPWLDDATITDWCRVVYPYAGPDYGALFVPEKKSEVLVAFVHGDMNEAIVIGGLYNGKDKPASYHDGKKQDVKLFKTKAGHEIRLDDSEKARAVELTTAAGHDITLDDQNHTLTISSQGGHLVELDDQSKKISISASGGTSKITIDSTGNISVQGTNIKLQATAITLAGKVNLG